MELRLLRPRRWDFLHVKATIDVSATQHTEQKRPMLLIALATSRLQHSALSRNDLCYCPQSLHQGCFSFHRFSCLSVPFAVPPIFVRSTAASMACFFRESLNLRILIELRLRAARRAVIGLPLPVRPSGFLKLEINNNVRTLAPLRVFQGRTLRPFDLQRLRHQRNMSFRSARITIESFGRRCYARNLTEVTGAGPRRLGPEDSKSPPAADGIASFGQCPDPGTGWQPASDSESEPASGTVTELVLALRLSDHDPAGGPTRRAPSDDDHLTMTVTAWASEGASTVSLYHATSM